MTAANVSVVIPAHDAASFIARAIRSVLNQTRQPREIIVVDDGSRDGTVDAVREACAGVTVLEQPNRGPGAARNRGALHATSELICFLDADDEYEPGMIATLSSALAKFPNARVASAAFYEEWFGRITRHPRAKAVVGDRNVAVLPDFFAAARRHRIVCTNSVMVQKRAFVEVGGFREDVRLGEDVDLWGRLAGRYDWVFVDVPVCTYHHLEATSVTLRTPDSSWPADILMTEERLRRWVRPELRRSYRLYRRDWLAERARGAIGRSAPARAQQLLREIPPAPPSVGWIATWLLARLPTRLGRTLLTWWRRSGDRAVAPDPRETAGSPHGPTAPQSRGPRAASAPGALFTRPAVLGEPETGALDSTIGSNPRGTLYHEP